MLSLIAMITVHIIFIDHQEMILMDFVTLNVIQIYKNAKAQVII